MPRSRKQASQDEALIAAVLNETEPGENELRTRVKGYDRAYEIYRADSERPKGLEPWRSFLRPKYALHNIDVALVNIAQGKPRCKVLPRTADDIQGAQAFQRLFDYYGDQDNLASKQAPLVQQALIYGVTVGKTHWLYKTGTAARRLQHPITGEYGVSAERVPVVLRDGPSFEPWSVYDAFWDPNGRNVDSCEWVALRSYVSKNYLLANACTLKGQHDPTECDGLYHNVDEFLATGTAKPGATAQDRVTGGNQNLNKDRFELVEYWRDDRLTVIGNKQVLLRDMPNPHWHGQKPVVIASCRPDLFKIQGIAETELVEDFQEALWTIENTRLENWHLTTWRGFTYRATIPDPGAIQIKPRALIPVTDHDDLQPIEVPPFPGEAYEEEQAVLARMQDVTGITPYVSGAQLGQTNQNTATGISILNSAASALLRFEAAQIHNGVWQPTFDQWGSDIQQFQTRDVAIRIVGPGGELGFVNAGPQEVVGEYDFVLEGTEESLSKQQEKQDIAVLIQTLAPFAQLGIINWKPILEKAARAYGFEDPQSLMQAQPQPLPPAAPTNGYQQPPQPNGQQTLMHGGNLPALVQAAVQAGGGLG